MFALVLVLLAFVGLSVSAQAPRTLRYGTAASVGIDQPALDLAVKPFRDAVARDELRGVVLMVARRGTIVLHEALGWRHVAYKLPMEKDTLFRMASNTKPVIATATLILEQDGKLGLNDRVGAHLSALDNYRWREVTIGHLLSHSSGLRIGPIFQPFDDEKGKTETPTLQGAVTKFASLGPEFAPRQRLYSYNNAGFNTAGAVIEHASGLALEDFLRDADLRAPRHDRHAQPRGRDRTRQDGDRGTLASGVRMARWPGRSGSRRAIRRTSRSFARRAGRSRRRWTTRSSSRCT